jgi:superfamily II DNA or RNA helicase
MPNGGLKVEIVKKPVYKKVRPLLKEANEISISTYSLGKKGLLLLKKDENFWKEHSRKSTLRVLANKVSPAAREMLIPDGETIIKKVPLLHAKVVLIKKRDGKRYAYVGSSNMTEQGLSRSEELGVLFEPAKNGIETSVIEECFEWYNKTYAEAQPLETTDVVLDERELDEDRFELFPYQKEAAKEAFDTISPFIKGDKSGGTLLVLPTGSGKTAVAAECVRKIFCANEDSQVLWVARQAELLLQARDHFVKHIPYFREKVFLAEGKKKIEWALEEPNVSVVFATVQSAKKVERWKRKFDLLVYDEAHHICGRPKKKEQKKNETEQLFEKKPYKALLGLTATPWRTEDKEENDFNRWFTEGKSIRSLLEKHSDNNDMAAKSCYAKVAFTKEQRKELLGNDGRRVLAEIKKGTIETDFPFKFESNNYQLEIQKGIRKFNDNSRNESIVNQFYDSYYKKGGLERVLVFACDVKHANALGKKLELKLGKRKVQVFHTGNIDTGTRTGNHIFGAGEGDVRNWALKNFERGEVPILVTVGLLTEGVDCPLVDCILIARPTFSTKLFWQMVGRGLRGPAVRGKDKCLVIDCVDQYLYHKEEVKKKLNLKTGEIETKLKSKPRDREEKWSADKARKAMPKKQEKISADRRSTPNNRPSACESYIRFCEELLRRGGRKRALSGERYNYFKKTKKGLRRPVRIKAGTNTYWIETGLSNNECAQRRRRLLKKCGYDGKHRF